MNTEPKPATTVDLFAYEPTRPSIAFFEPINDPVNNPVQESKQIWKPWMDWAVIGLGLFAAAWAVIYA